MTDEYTPTTEDIRRSYQCEDESCATQDGQEFDRWLAAHDAEIRRDQAEKIIDWIENLKKPGFLNHALAADLRAQFPTPSPETEQENTR